MDPSYPLVPIANIIASLLVLLSFSTTLLRNVPVTLLAGWVSMTSFIRAVDSIIWSNNVRDTIPMWCTITTHIDVGSNVVIPMCSFAITRRLYLITRISGSIQSRYKTEMIIDCLICFLPPTAVVISYHFLQTERYQIVEELGCSIASVNSRRSLVFLYVWTVIFPAISTILYGPHTFRFCCQYRRGAELDIDSKISIGDYLRFLALGWMNTFFVLPLGIITLVLTYREEPIGIFWRRWSTSDTLSTVRSVLASSWTPNIWDNFGVRWDQWFSVLISCAFFFLYGLNSRTRKRYRSLFRYVLRRDKLDPLHAITSEVVFRANDITAGNPRTKLEEGHTDHVDVANASESNLHNTSRYSKRIRDINNNLSFYSQNSSFSNFGGPTTQATSITEPPSVYSGISRSNYKGVSV